MADELQRVVAGAREALGEAAERVGADAAPPRYELFHAAQSVCSQKARAVLAHHGFAYVGRPMNLFAGQTYLPGYVRLRMRGCESFGGALVAHHSGSTSAERGGCDGAVAPTLVDWSTGEVVVDSKRICLHLDAQAPAERRLRPAALAAAVDAELMVVDDLPNYQMLMNRTSVAETADTRQEAMAAFSRRKVGWCDTYLQEHAGDETLTRAYAAKRAKEASAADRLFSPEAMEIAYGKAEDALRALEARLDGRGDEAWLVGPEPTLADLFWGVELVRMLDVGAAGFWEGGRLPRVERFAAATHALPAIRAALIDWPGARPQPKP